MGCFLDTKIVGLQEQSKNLSNPSESPTPSEIDFSIHDKPGIVSLQKIKLNSAITNSAASITSQNSEFSIKFVDISGANDVKLVKVPFDGSAPTYWDLPFLIESNTQISFLKMHPNSDGLAFVASIDNSSTRKLYYFDFNTGTTSCLSCPMAAGGGIDYNNGKDLQFVNNNTRIVFFGDVDVLGRKEIYSNNLAGSDLLKLNGPVSGTGTFSTFIVNPNRVAIAFVGNHTASSPNQLFYVSTLGTGRTRVSPDGVPNSTVYYDNKTYFFSPDGNKLVFTQDRDTLGKTEVFVSNINGSNNIKLNSTIVPAGGDVTASAISLDGTKVIYAGDQDVDGARELYSVNIDGTGYSKLGPSLVTGRRSLFFTFDPSGTKIIYGSEPTTAGVFNLYSVNLDGTNSQLLVTGFGRLGGVYPDPSVFFINSSQFYFLGDFDFDYRYNLYRINLDGTGQTTIYTQSSEFSFYFPAQISQMYDSTTGRFYFSLLKVSPNAVCKIKSIDLNGANERTLYDCDTGLPYLKGQHTIVSGNRIVYETTDRKYSSTLDFASTTELYKNGTGNFYGLKFSPDSKKLVGSMAQKDANGKDLRFSIFDLATKSLTDPLPSSWGHGYNFLFSSDSQSVVLSLVQALPMDHIHKLGLDGSALTNLTPTHGAEFFWGHRATYSPDEQYIVYSADHDADMDTEIVSMRTDGSNWTMIHPPLFKEAGTFEVSSQNNKVVFTAQRDSSVFELFSSNIDGTGHIKLNSALVGATPGIYEFKLSPDGNTVLYIAAQNTSGVYELYKVNIDGSGMQRLNPALSGSQIVNAAEFTPDGNRAILIAQIDNLTTNELYKVNKDGTGFAKINPSFEAGGGIDIQSQLLYTSDSNNVVYKAFASSANRSDVFITNLNSLHSICVSCAFQGANSKIGAYSLSNSEGRIYFTYDSRGKDLYDLYSIKIDGTDLRKLNVNLLASKDKVVSFKTISGAVIYLQYKNGNTQLFKVNGDGTNHVRLHNDLTGFKNVSNDYLVSPDSKKLIYFINENEPSYADMYITDL